MQQQYDESINSDIDRWTDLKLAQVAYPDVSFEADNNGAVDRGHQGNVNNGCQPMGHLWQDPKAVFRRNEGQRVSQDGTQD